MKPAKKIAFLLFFMLPFFVYGKSILIGDSIPIRVKGIPSDKIQEAFDNLSKEKDITMEEIKNDENGNTIVKFRSFSIGENTLNLDNKSIKFVVKSSLTEEEQKEVNKEIFLNMEDKSNQRLYWGNIPYKGIIGMALLFFVLLSFLRKIKFKKKDIIINPDEKFQKGINKLSSEKWQYELSYLLREYIDNKYKSRFLNGEYEKIGKINNKDIDFIYQLDNFKFAPKNKDLQVYIKEMQDRAYEIYNKIKEENV